jgi:hypothetical protein
MIENFNFDPEDGYENDEIFPTDATSETEARQMFNVLLFQIKDFLNTEIIPAINELQGGQEEQESEVNE